MGRILGIGIIVLGVWVALEVYDQGIDGAFGGAFSGVASSLEAPAERSTPDRAADAFQRAYNKSESRVDQALAGD